MENVICQECSNGCKLRLEWENIENVFITGNQCADGVIYAANIIRKDSKVRIHAREETPSFSEETLTAIAGLWQVHLEKLHYNIPVQGSPERSVFRVVLEDRTNNFFVLEQIPSKSLKLKQQIAATLDFLSKKDLPLIQPYLSGENGNYIITYKNNFWQMMPLIAGVPLDRGKYMYDKWRGMALAAFLVALRRKSKNLLFCDSRNVFLLKDYIQINPRN